MSSDPAPRSVVSEIRTVRRLARKTVEGNRGDRNWRRTVTTQPFRVLEAGLLHCGSVKYTCIALVT
jgi:hypothetical protein